MSIRLIAITLAATFALAAPAFAGEGNGNTVFGPDNAVTHTVTKPKYTMGSAAPFNYFSPGTTYSTRNTTVNGAPFGMSGRTARVAPAVTGSSR